MGTEPVREPSPDDTVIAVIDGDRALEPTRDGSWRPLGSVDDTYEGRAPRFAASYLAARDAVFYVPAVRLAEVTAQRDEALAAAVRVKALVDDWWPRTLDSANLRVAVLAALAVPEKGTQDA